jgi:hypothetical protein
VRHYRATPIRGTPGEPVTARGLRALYEAANERWGMVSTYPSVRGNMLPEGRIYRVNDDGWVNIELDPGADASYEIEQENRADDRETDYMADVWVTVFQDGKYGMEERWTRQRAKGLGALITHAASLVQSKLKGIPPSMEPDAVKMRVRNMRSQMSKSRDTGKPVYSIAFPPIKEPNWKAPNNWEVRVFVDVAKDYEAPLNVRGFVRREKDET